MDIPIMLKPEIIRIRPVMNQIMEYCITLSAAFNDLYHVTITFTSLCKTLLSL